jgi:hypothetical protein
LEKRRQVQLRLEEESEYWKCFTNTVEEFLRRFLARLGDKALDKERARRLCLDYLIEECSAFCLWIELEAQFEVYPSRRNLALKATFERFVQPLYPNLLQAVSIKFKNRRQFQPQDFQRIKIGEKV